MSKDIDYVHNLEKTKLTREQAEAMVKIIRDTVADGLEPVIGRIDSLRGELEGKIMTSQHRTMWFVIGSALSIIAAIFIRA